MVSVRMANSVQQPRLCQLTALSRRSDPGRVRAQRLHRRAAYRNGTQNTAVKRRIVRIRRYDRDLAREAASYLPAPEPSETDVVHAR
jgi:hypothetical protein